MSRVRRAFRALGWVLVLLGLYQGVSGVWSFLLNAPLGVSGTGLVSAWIEVATQAISTMVLGAVLVVAVSIEQRIIGEASDGTR